MIKDNFSSVTMPFYLKLHNLNLSDNKYLKYIGIYLKYLLGTLSYRDVITIYPKDVATAFRQTLLVFKDKETLYCRNSLRRFSRGENIDINEIDSTWIETLELKNTKFKVLRYPSTKDIYDSMIPSITNKVNSMFVTLPKKVKTFHSKIDIINNILIRVLEMYRIYIYSYNTVLDIKAFYKILHNRARFEIVDFIRNVFSKKRDANIVSIDSENLSDTENTVSLIDKLYNCQIDSPLVKYSSYPENNLMFKEGILRTSLLLPEAKVFFLENFNVANEDFL